MELIQRKSWEGADVSPDGGKGNSSLPGGLFRGGGAEVRLAEIMFDPAGDDEGSEWVMIYNNGTDPQDLDGWGLSNGDGEVDALLPDWTLPGASTLYVHFGMGEDESDFEDFVGRYYTNNPYEIFDNTADAVALFSGDASNTTMVDYMGWKLAGVTNFTGGRAGTWASNAGVWSDGDLVIDTGFDEGVSLGRRRIDPALDTSADWETGRLVINEVMFKGMSDGNGSDLGNEYVELANPTDATVSTHGWLLKVDDGIIYPFPGFDVPPKSFVVLHITAEQASGDLEETEDDTDMSDGIADLYFPWDVQVLGDDSGALGLYCPDGMVDYVSWGTAGTGSVSTDAGDAGIWTSGSAVGGTFVAGDSIGRDQFSTDADLASDWAVGGGSFANGPTLGTSNYYNIMIWTADLFSAAGDEWIKISNFGTDVDVNGWKLYNRGGNAVATLPDVTLPAGSSLTIHLGVGTDDLDFGDWDGHFYTEGAQGQAPASKLFNASLDIVIISTGELETESVVTLEVWLEDGFGARGTRGWWSDAWNAVKGAASWTARKVSQAVHGIVNGVLRCSKWLLRQINRLKSWVKGMLNGAVSFNIDVGDYLSLSLTVSAMGWRFHAEANAEVNIPVPGFPILQLHLAAQGTLDIVKGCGGISSSGQIVLTVGVNLGAKIKKLFTLELRAHLRLTITVGNLNIDDYCNPETHQGTVTVGLDIALDLVLGATFKLNRPEFTLLDKDWDWNLAQFTWSQTREYQCCRDPKIKPGPEPYPYPKPKPEPSPPYYYDECGAYVYADAHITNTDDVPHTYNYGTYTSTPGWDTHLSAPSGPIAPGSTEGLYPYLEAGCDIYRPHTFEPVVGLGSGLPGQEYVRSRGDSGDGTTFSGDEYYGFPGSSVAIDLLIGNQIEDVYMVDVTIWASAQENESLNSSLTMYSPVEMVNITVESESEWDTAVYNEDGYFIWGVPDFSIGNFKGMRQFRAVIEIPEEAEIGTVENVTLGAYSSILDNFTAAHIDNMTAKIKVIDHIEREIWSSDLEDEVEMQEWRNWSGEWQWGKREGAYAQYALGPQSDEPGPHIWATNITGMIEEGLVSILETPALDLSDYDVVNLRVTQWIRAWANNIDIFVNSSGVWYQIWDMSSVYSSMWQEKTFDISPFLSDQVSFVFYFKGRDDSYPGWHITDVSLVAYYPAKVFWHDELENGTEAARWSNGTGQWEWGLREDLGYGPRNDGPFPNMWGIKLDGTASEEVISVLESPVFDLSSYDVVNLGMWHWLNADGEVMLFVNDSGQLHLIGNWSGYNEWSGWEYDSMDITAYISDSVRFVFYFNATLGSSMNVGWHINNLSLAKRARSDIGIVEITPVADGEIHLPGSKEITVTVENTGDMTFEDVSVGVRPVYTGKNVIFSDDFESDEGWTISGGTWERNDELNFGADGGMSMTTVEPTRGGAGVHTLLSPVINLTGVSSPTLTFWENSWFEEDGGYRCELYFSNDSGLTWSDYALWSEIENSHGHWEKADLSLDGYVCSEFRMKFVVMSYSRQFVPHMTIDRLEITGVSPDELSHSMDIIESIAPGEEKNVTLTVDLSQRGSYTMSFYVNCSMDGNYSDNYNEMSIFVNQFTVGGLDSLDGEEVTGSQRLEMEWRDVNADLVRFHYRPETRGGNLSLIGEVAAPDNNMVWGLDWDTDDVDDGNYTIVAEVLDLWGGSASVEASLTVKHPNGTIEANFTHQEVVGVPGTFVFSDNSDYDPAKVSIIAHYWDFGDGADSCLETPTHTYLEDGTYTFYHSVTASTGEVFAISAPILIIGAQQIPELDVNFSIDPEAGITKLTDVTFNDTTEIPVGLVVERRWDLGDGNTSTAASVTHRYSHSGVYDANLSFFKEDGKFLGALIRKVAVQNLLPVPDFTFTPAAARVGEQFNFTDRSTSEDGPISSWSWDFDSNLDSDSDGDPCNDRDATGRNVTHTFTGPGKMTVTLNVTDEEGTHGIKKRNVFVLEEGRQDLQIIEVRQGEIRTLKYTDPSGGYIDVKVSGDGTLVAAKIDEHVGDDIDGPENVTRISFYIDLSFDGVLNWTNITISYADMPENESLNYSQGIIYYTRGIMWYKAENTGVDTEKQIVWANVTHFTIFAAYAPAKSEEIDGGGDTDGQEDKESWYMSTSVIVAGVAILVVLVLLGVFLYVRSQAGDEEGEDDFEDDIREAEEVIKEIREKEEMEGEGKEDEGMEDEGEVADEGEGKEDEEEDKEKDEEKEGEDMVKGEDKEDEALPGEEPSGEDAGEGEEPGEDKIHGEPGDAVEGKDVLEVDGEETGDTADGEQGVGDEDEGADEEFPLDLDDEIGGGEVGSPGDDEPPAPPEPSGVPPAPVGTDEAEAIDDEFDTSGVLDEMDDTPPEPSELPDDIPPAEETTEEEVTEVFDEVEDLSFLDEAVDEPPEPVSEEKDGDDDMIQVLSIIDE